MPYRKHKTCTSKIQYRTRKKAVRGVNRRNTEREFVGVYKCPFCRKWHGTLTPKPTRTGDQRLLATLQAKDVNLIFASTHYTYCNYRYKRLVDAGAYVELVRENKIWKIKIK